MLCSLYVIFSLLLNNNNVSSVGESCFPADAQVYNLFNLTISVHKGEFPMLRMEALILTL